jgi:hypothetical protein
MNRCCLEAIHFGARQGQFPRLGDVADAASADQIPALFNAEIVERSGTHPRRRWAMRGSAK